MFFLNRGMAEVVSEDGMMVYATLNEGQFFGEISLVYDCPRTASIRWVATSTVAQWVHVCYRAITNCDLFVLTKTDLDAALKYYPHISAKIQEVASIRANLLDQHHVQVRQHVTSNQSVMALPAPLERGQQESCCELSTIISKFRKWRRGGWGGPESFLSPWLCTVLLSQCMAST